MAEALLLVVGCIALMDLTFEYVEAQADRNLLAALMVAEAEPG